MTVREPSVASVTVAFNAPLTRLEMQVEGLLLQAAHVIVVDNGSTLQLARSFRGDLSERVSWVTHSANLGIAGGLNAGIERASELGAEFVLCMDHDSILTEGSLSALLMGLVSAEQAGVRVAAVGARISDPRNASDLPFIKLGWLRNRRVYCESREKRLIETDFLISSGCLARIGIFAEGSGVGPLDASLFIDSVDFEWCCRARARGFHLYGVCNATLDHRLGDARRPLFGRFSIVIHSPARLYYMTRNRIALYRRSYVPIRWKFNDILRMIAKTSLTLLFVAPRLAYLQNIARGAIDALRGRTGA